MSEALTAVHVAGRRLTGDDLDGVLRMAAAGMAPPAIAAATGLDGAEAAEFVRLAATPGSPVAALMAEGRANGLATPQVKALEAATAGNLDAVRTLRRIQSENLYDELLAGIDDDELAL